MSINDGINDIAHLETGEAMSTRIKRAQVAIADAFLGLSREEINEVIDKVIDEVLDQILPSDFSDLYKSKNLLFFDFLFIF